MFPPKLLPDAKLTGGPRGHPHGQTLANFGFQLVKHAAPPVSGCRERAAEGDGCLGDAEGAL
jgi:hypothetical protein